MADAKISQLTEVTAPAISDVLPIVSGGATKKVAVENVPLPLGFHAQSAVSAAFDSSGNPVFDFTGGFAVFNSGWTMDGSGHWPVPQTGRYLVVVWLTIQAFTNSAPYALVGELNFVSSVDSPRFGVTGAVYLPGSSNMFSNSIIVACGYVEMKAGDIISVDAYHNGNGTLTLTADLQVQYVCPATNLP